MGLLELQAERPRLANGTPQAGVDAAQMRERMVCVEGKSIAVSDTTRPSESDVDALEAQHSGLGVDAAGGGEAAGLTAGSEDAVAGHDDRERVFAEGLAHRARRAGGAEPGGDLAVRKRAARGDRAHRLVDAAMEGGQAVHVKRELVEARALAAEQTIDVLDGTNDRARRRLFGRLGAADEKTGPRRSVARPGQR